MANMFFANRLVLECFEVWHNWSLYSVQPLPDLHKVAQCLVSSGFCEVAFHTDEVVYWHEDGQSRKSDVTIQRIGHEPRCSFQIPEGMESYQAEHLYAAIEMRFEEIKNQSVSTKDKVTYVRAAMSPCEFVQEGHPLSLYPQLKIYENGVITLSFRIMGAIECSADQLIEYFIHLPQFNTTTIRLNPTILYWFRMSGFYRKENIKERFERSRSEPLIRGAIKSETVTEKFGDFSHPFVPIAPNPKEAIYNLGTLVECIYIAFFTLLDPPRLGWQYILFGPKNIRIDCGAYVSGFPNVYILRTKDQPHTASGVRKKYGAEISRILTGVTSRTISDRAAKAVLSPTLRPLFEDCTVHMNSAQAVWFYSKDGFGKDNGQPISHQNSHVFAVQPKAEFIMYVYASYQRLSEKSSKPIHRLRDILSVRNEMHDLADICHQPYSAVELDEMCEYAWREFNVAALKRKITESLELQSQRLRDFEEARNRSAAILLTSVFGVVGAAGLTTSVVAPLWNSLKWWQPSVKDQQPAFYFLVTATLLVLLFRALRFIAYYSPRNRE